MAEGRRYLGLDVLARAHTSDTNTVEDVAEPELQGPHGLTHMSMDDQNSYTTSPDVTRDVADSGCVCDQA